MITPIPKEFAALPGALVLPVECGLWLDPAFGADASVLSACLGTSPADMPSAAVRVTMDASLPPEGYAWEVLEDGARGAAADLPGAVHALFALLQLGDGSRRLPCCRIKDAPRFPQRGLSIDVCRHFFGTDTIKRLIDLMALYRMNRLHLHLSDDQGFRVESRRFPLLNTVGAYRRSSDVKRGRGLEADGVPHGGYYTQEEIRMLVGYAAARGIDVVPELDIPGHALAMIAAYPALSCRGEAVEVTGSYGVRDFSATILCAGKDETLAFLFALLEEWAQLFPGQTFHLGGDEAVKTEWARCPRCRERKRALGLSSDRELQGWLLKKCAAHLRTLGKRVVCWNDALADTLPADVVCQHWTPGAHQLRRTLRELNAGRDTVFSPFLHYYFDYPYAMTSLKKVYRYRVVPRGVRAEAKGHVLGVEACIWTEWIADADRLFYQLLPRLAAVAEAGWSMPERRSYADFVQRLPLQYRLYERLGLAYRADAARTVRLGKRILRTAAFACRDADIERRRGDGLPR